LLQRLKGAIVPPMTETTVVHIKWDGLLGNPIFRSECESCVFVDVTANKPRRRGPINARPWSSHPEPSFVISRINLLGLGPVRSTPRLIRACEQLADTLLQRNTKKINLDNLLIARP